MNDLAASVGLGNLDDMPAILDRRTTIAQRYRRELSSVPGITLLKHADDRKSAHWLFTLLVEKREPFIRKLAERGVPASVVHLRIDHNSVFGGLTPNLPNMERFNERQVAIPVHEALSDDDVSLIVRTIREGW